MPSSLPDPTTDEQYLRQAVRLAMNGRGKVEPNPMVGCVLVKNGHVIGEGNHAEYGGPHAEPTALANCTDSPEGATAYVTLEPCCHTNKKTPPCVPELIDAKIARVVIGCLDPNPDVNGKGVALLRTAGIRVDGPVLEASAKQLIAPFLVGTLHKRPYVTLKWAQTADGKVAGPGGQRLAITNSVSNRLIHRLRSRCDAIAVGVNTVLNDNPSLTTRGVRIIRNTTKVVLDTHLRIPPSADVLDEAETFIYASFAADIAAQQRLQARQAIVQRVSLGADGHIRFDWVLSDLFASDRCTHLLVEPGPTLAASIFRDNLADRVWVFESPMKVNDDSAPTATPVPEHYIQTGKLDLARDTLTEYLNPNSQAYYAPEPSADFILAKQQLTPRPPPLLP